jgi:Cdc6-like AAA superfamily ATPase
MYGLKQNYFLINPKKEYEIFFAREAEFQKFYEDLVGTIDSGRVPRYVVFGLFGVGKTHFLLHLKYMLANSVDAIYVETPASHRRTSFVEFYRAIISALGRTAVTELLTDGLKKPAKMVELGLSEDLVHVTSNAVKEKKSFVLWKFISGEKLKGAEAEMLEAVRPELSADDAVALLNAIAVLRERANKKPLLLLVDEFETTMNIGGDAKMTFTESMRSLVDEGSKVGMVIALTARAMSEMPAPIYEDSVRRRIGVTNYIPFQEYDGEELETFMRQVIRYRREASFDAKKVPAQTNETVNVATYPFSEEALREIANSVILFREQGKIEAVRPREALEIMDKALRLAIVKKLPFIGKDAILAVREEVVEVLRL